MTTRQKRFSIESLAPSSRARRFTPAQIDILIAHVDHYDVDAGANEEPFHPAVIDLIGQPADNGKPVTRRMIEKWYLRQVVQSARTTVDSERMAAHNLSVSLPDEGVAGNLNRAGSEQGNHDSISTYQERLDNFHSKKEEEGEDSSMTALSQGELQEEAQKESQINAERNNLLNDRKDETSEEENVFDCIQDEEQGSGDKHTGGEVKSEGESESGDGDDSNDDDEYETDSDGSDDGKGDADGDDVLVDSKQSEEDGDVSKDDDGERDGKEGFEEDRKGKQEAGMLTTKEKKEVKESCGKYFIDNATTVSDCMAEGGIASQLNRRKLTYDFDSIVWHDSEESALSLSEGEKRESSGESKSEGEVGSDEDDDGRAEAPDKEIYQSPREYQMSDDGRKAISEEDSCAVDKDDQGDFVDLVDGESDGEEDGEKQNRLQGASFEYSDGFSESHPMKSLIGLDGEQDPPVEREHSSAVDIEKIPEILPTMNVSTSNMIYINRQGEETDDGVKSIEEPEDEDVFDESDTTEDSEGNIFGEETELRTGREEMKAEKDDYEHKKTRTARKDCARREKDQALAKDTSHSTEGEDTQESEDSDDDAYDDEGGDTASEGESDEETMSMLILRKPTEEEDNMTMLVLPKPEENEENVKLVAVRESSVENEAVEASAPESEIVSALDMLLFPKAEGAVDPEAKVPVAMSEVEEGEVADDERKESSAQTSASGPIVILEDETLIAKSVDISASFVEEEEVVEARSVNRTAEEWFQNNSCSTTSPVKGGLSHSDTKPSSATCSLNSSLSSSQDVEHETASSAETKSNWSIAAKSERVDGSPKSSVVKGRSGTKTKGGAGFTLSRTEKKVDPLQQGGTSSPRRRSQGGSTMRKFKVRLTKFQGKDNIRILVSNENSEYIGYISATEEGTVTVSDNKSSSSTIFHHEGTEDGSFTLLNIKFDMYLCSQEESDELSLRTVQGTHTFLQWENKDQWRALQASEMRPVRLHEDGYLFIGDGGGVVRMKFEKLEQSTTSLSPRMNRLSGGSGLETRKNPKKEKDRFKDSQYVKIKVTSSNLQLLGYLHAHEVGTFGIVDSTKKSSSTSASQFVIVMEENENETAGPPINRLFSVRLNKYLCCENEQIVGTANCEDVRTGIDMAESEWKIFSSDASNFLPIFLNDDNNLQVGETSKALRFRGEPIENSSTTVSPHSSPLLKGKKSRVTSMRDTAKSKVAVGRTLKSSQSHDREHMTSRRDRETPQKRKEEKEKFGKRSSTMFLRTPSLKDARNNSVAAFTSTPVCVSKFDRETGSKHVIITCQVLGSRGEPTVTISMDPSITIYEVKLAILRKVSRFDPQFASMDFISNLILKRADQGWYFEDEAISIKDHPDLREYCTTTPGLSKIPLSLMSSVMAKEQGIFCRPPLLEDKEEKESSLIQLMSQQGQNDLKESRIVAESETVLKQGHLSKQGGGSSRRNWNLRWFVMTKEGLAYYKTQEMREQKGFIPWQELSELPTPVKRSEKRPWCFALTLPTRTYMIEAQTKEERNDWINAIAGALTHLKKVTLDRDIMLKSKQKRRDLPPQQSVSRPRLFRSPSIPPELAGPASPRKKGVASENGPDREWLKEHRPRSELPHLPNDLHESLNQTLTTQKEQKLEKMRTNMVKEFVDTEKSYVADLKGTLTSFSDPLQSILSEQDADLFFGLFPLFIENHKKLCQSLAQRWKKWSPTSSIGDIMVDWLPSLQIYQNFAANINTVSAKISTLSKENEAFKAAVKKCKYCMYKGIEGLRSLVTGIPMQRVMRYRLMLDSLRKYTPTSHPDYDDVVDAFYSSEIFLSNINRVKGQAESRARRKQVWAKLHVEKGRALSVADFELNSHCFAQHKHKVVQRCEACSLIIRLSDASLRCSTCKKYIHEQCNGGLPPNCEADFKSAKNLQNNIIHEYMGEFSCLHKEFSGNAGTYCEEMKQIGEEVLCIVFSASCLIVKQVTENDVERLEVLDLVQFYCQKSSRYATVLQISEKVFSLTGPLANCCYHEFTFKTERATQEASKLLSSGIGAEKEEQEGSLSSTTLSVTESSNCYTFTIADADLLGGVSGDKKTELSKFYVYIVTVTAQNGQTWTVHKRFNQFQDLYQDLTRILGHQDRSKMAFPTYIKKWGKSEAELVKERCPKFQRFLNVLNEFDGVWDLPCVRSFLTSDVVWSDVSNENGELSEEKGKDEKQVKLKALHDYSGTEPHSLAFLADDVFLCAESEMLHMWRFVTPLDKPGDHGFVPSNHVIEV